MQFGLLRGSLARPSRSSANRNSSGRELNASVVEWVNNGILGSLQTCGTEAATVAAAAVVTARVKPAGEERRGDCSAEPAMAAP
eukprot:2283851-Pyramimonas_sp.AAC.1